jgi:hypothetical protein
MMTSMSSEQMLEVQARKNIIEADTLNPNVAMQQNIEAQELHM